MEDQFINVAEPGSRVTNLNATRTELIPTPRLPRSGSSMRLCGLLAALGSISGFVAVAPLGSQETELVETAAIPCTAITSTPPGSSPTTVPRIVLSWPMAVGSGASPTSVAAFMTTIGSPDAPIAAVARSIGSAVRGAVGNAW